MTSTPVEIGTLIVVILKAKNLPNKRHIGKQDPYCSVKLNDETRRTRAVRRGGQHPEWDEEVRFTLMEDVEDELARTATEEAAGDDPPPPPPKTGKKKVKGAKKMQLMCYADDPREPDLIGETMVDLTEVLTKGETDEWFTLTNKEKYCGEVYLELTFWSNEKPPEKQATPKASAFHPQYGGPGSFTPSSDLPAALKHGGSNQNTPSPSRLPSNGGPDAGLPSSLRPSGSLANLSLYNAPYEQQNRYGDTVDQLSNGIAGLDFDNPSRHRESFTRQSGPSEFGYVGTLPSHHSGSFSTLSSSSSLSSIHSLGSSLGARPAQGHPRNSLSSLPEPFVQEDYSPGHSRIASVPESYPPESQYQYPHASSGFVAPLPSHTPVPSHNASGSHQISSFVPPPQLPASVLGYHPPQLQQQQYTFTPQTSFQPPYPQPPASAPPNQYLSSDGSPAPSSVPPVSHSAPPQQYIPHGTPSPPHNTQSGLPAPNAYQQMQPSNLVPNPRPLPTPQPPQQPYKQSPTGPTGFGTPPSGPPQPVAPGSIMFPNTVPFQPPGPPPPPPPRRGDSLPPTPTKTSPASFPPPPPPPPLQNSIQPPQKGPYFDTPPRPPLPPAQPYDGQPSSISPHGPVSSLPQPPQQLQGFGGLPPPPPPPPSLSSYPIPSHAPPPLNNYPALPHQSQQPQYPGLPPHQPPQFPAGTWNAPPPHQDGWHS